MKEAVTSLAYYWTVCQKPLLLKWCLPKCRLRPFVCVSGVLLWAKTKWIWINRCSARCQSFVIISFSQFTEFLTINSFLLSIPYFEPPYKWCYLEGANLQGIHWGGLADYYFPLHRWFTSRRRIPTLCSSSSSSVEWLCLGQEREFCSTSPQISKSSKHRR